MTLEELTELFANRSSTRAFQRDPLPRDLLASLFGAAQRAPSWCNIQPWRVSLLSKDKTAEVSKALVATASSSVPSPELPFPGEYPEPYLARRRACGGALYGAMGIERGDKKGRWGAWLRNYEIFDAPHLAVVSRDKCLGEYATLDVGVWLGYLFASAASAGVGMCAMASIAAYPAVLRSHLDIPESDVVLFGLALGWRDADAAANRCVTDREEATASLTFVGFDS